MPKKKGGKLTKGARQNRREKMLVRKQSATLVPAAETVEGSVETAESAEAVAPAAAPADEKLAVTVEPEKKPATKKTAAAKKPGTKKTATENKPKDTAVPTEKKKPGPNPKTAEQKTEAPKRRKTLKNGVSNEMTTVYIQYKGKEDGVEDLIAAARADYKAAHKRTPINSIKLYVKPEEYTAYYVVNDSYFDKIKM